MLLFLRLLLLCGLVIAQQDLTLYQRASLFVKHSLQLNSARQLSASLRTAFKSLARRQQQPLHSGAQCRLKQPAIGLTDDHGQATSPTTASSTRSARPSAQPTSVPPSPYRIAWNYTGNDFFNSDLWSFWDAKDPTNGCVDYIPANEAQDIGLAYVNDGGQFVMKVETTPRLSRFRKSIRITTQEAFLSFPKREEEGEGGLLLMDSTHMPTGCGTWPAWWTNGPNWPENGEIDIAEGVSDHTYNQATVHTARGCQIPSRFNNATEFAEVATGRLVGGTNCAVADTSNQGCGVRFQEEGSFGAAFNAINGGVYALSWDDSGLSVYFFPRSKIPQDIIAGQPNPSRWGKPSAKWVAGACDPYRFFRDHVAIFDTTLCGDWAGGVWGNSGIPGQEESCAQRTGYSDCVDYVLNNGDAFKEAYWEVSYVRLYHLK